MNEKWNILENKLLFSSKIVSFLVWFASIFPLFRSIELLFRRETTTRNRNKIHYFDLKSLLVVCQLIVSDFGWNQQINNAKLWILNIEHGTQGGKPWNVHPLLVFFSLPLSLSLSLSIHFFSRIHNNALESFSWNRIGKRQLQQCRWLNLNILKCF